MGICTKKLLIAISCLMLSNITFAKSLTWTVSHRSWSAHHEQKFSEFVAKIGRSRCSSLHRCLLSPKSNPFYARKTPRSIRYLADCADLPYMLRAYFAWMERLPFDYVNGVSPVSRRERIRDIRYTKYGNKPRSRRRLTYGRRYNAAREFARIRNSVSTATFRIHYKYISDFYPTKIDRKYIRPGTVLYDSSGHAAVVYRVERDGRIRLMDAHPDQSITRITYGKKFARSLPRYGAGIKNWRPELSMTSSKKLKGFSTEQYKRKFTLKRRRVGYYDYIRSKLAVGKLVYNPVHEFKSMLGELCDSVQDRINAVNEAIKAGIVNKPHPKKLPRNIYGTSGIWENYSTPSRDARLKVAFLELKKSTERFISMYKAKNSRIRYTPTQSAYSKYCQANDNVCNLAANLMSKYTEITNSPRCKFTYRNSYRRKVTLHFNDIIKRLFLLSFDPYHCVELRWGASSVKELKSCRNGRKKLAWYRAQQKLRNQLTRTYNRFMGYGIAGTPKLGTAKQPNVDVWSYLKSHVNLNR